MRLLGSSPRLVREAAACIGVDGMIGGQAADVMGAEMAARDRKTSALMRLTLMAGAEAGGAPAQSVALLAQCGERLGRAYQMLDDLSDNWTGRGKTVGQDERHCRPSWSVSRDAILTEVSDCGLLLARSLGSAADPLVDAVEAVFGRLAEAGLVAA